MNIIVTVRRQGLLNLAWGSVMRPAIIHPSPPLNYSETGFLLSKHFSKSAVRPWHKYII